MAIFFRSLNRRNRRTAAFPTIQQPQSRILAFESLEDRRLLNHAPLNFTVTNTGGAGLRLEWTDNGATGYEIQSSVNGLNDEGNPIAWKTGLWRTTKTEPAGSQEATFNRFRAYYFRIQALPAESTPLWSTIEYTSAPPEDNVVKVSAAATNTGQETKITLNWPEELKFSSATYTISRWNQATGEWDVKISGYDDNDWWEDTNVTAGESYEYKVVRSPGNGTGYVYAGVDFALDDDDSTIQSPGTVILVVDATQAAALTTELDRLEDDLVAEGWGVEVIDNVNPTDMPGSVKTKIKNIYDPDPANVKAVLLIGPIPIPMSGHNNPDGHGPRPMAADVYYGDMDGVWTDVTDYCLPTALCGPRAPEINAPNEAGDGIFDQKEVPVAPDGNRRVELMVGRVDMRKLTFFSTYDEKLNETALLKRYLDKDHAFRTGQISVERQGRIRDYLGSATGSSSGAWGTISGFVGPAAEPVPLEPDNIDVNKWSDTIWPIAVGLRSIVTADLNNDGVEVRTNCLTLAYQAGKMAGDLSLADRRFPCSRGSSWRSAL